jgi:cell division protein FtsW (lipid II flippase)
LTWGRGRLAWALAVIILLISVYEFAEPDFGSGFGLFIVFLALLFVLRRYKVKW